MEQTTNNPENDILVMDVYLIITDGKTVADARFYLWDDNNGLEELRTLVNERISELAIGFQSMYFADPKDIKTIAYPVVSQMPERQYKHWQANFPKRGLTKLTHEPAQ